MALIEVDGTAAGTADVTGPLAIVLGLAGTASGAGASVSTPSLICLIEYTLTGVAYVLGPTERVFNVSGFVAGSGNAVDARIQDLEAAAIGSGTVGGALACTTNLRGYAFGSSAALVSAPEPIFGVAVVGAFMEVVCVPYAVCQTPQVQKRFRWGQQLGAGDLEMCFFDASGNASGPVYISYTLYQIQKACAPKQFGASDRKPGSNRVGCYYATGAAGECGQPGLWMIRWRYQQTFGGGTVERDCYFYVLDSVLLPVLGDTLPRVCKYGWD